MKTRGKVLKWGNSWGIRVNKTEAERAGIHINDDVEVEVMRKVTTVKDVFGTLPRTSRRETLRILKEIDESWGER